MRKEWNYITGELRRVTAASPVKLAGQVEEKTHIHAHIAAKFGSNWKFNRLRDLFEDMGYQVNLQGPIVNLKAACEYVQKDDTRFQVAGASGVETFSVLDPWWSDILTSGKRGNQGKRTDIERARDAIVAAAKAGSSYGQILSMLMKDHGTVLTQYVTGVRLMIQTALEDNAPKVKLPQTLMPWQKQFVEFFTDDANRDDRTIHIYVGAEGNEGKSMMAHYMREKHNWVNLYGDERTMAYILKKEYGTGTIKGVSVDLTRAHSGEAITAIAKFLEHVKSGYVISEKFESSKIILDQAHVVVFCNEIPPGVKEPMTDDKTGEKRFLWSKDRVKITHVYRQPPPHAAAKRARMEMVDENE